MEEATQVPLPEPRRCRWIRTLGDVWRPPRLSHRQGSCQRNCVQQNGGSGGKSPSRSSRIWRSSWKKGGFPKNSRCGHGRGTAARVLHTSVLNNPSLIAAQRSTLRDRGGSLIASGQAGRRLTVALARTGKERGIPIALATTYAC